MKNFLSLILISIIFFVGCSDQVSNQNPETVEENSLKQTNKENASCTSNCLNNYLNIPINVFVRIDKGEIRGAGTEIGDGEYASYLEATNGKINFGNYEFEDQIEVIIRMSEVPVSEGGLEGAKVQFGELSDNIFHHFESVVYPDGTYEVSIHFTKYHEHNKSTSGRYLTDEDPNIQHPD